MSIRKSVVRLLAETARTWTNNGILYTEEYAQIREAVVKLATAQKSQTPVEQRFLTGPEVAEKLGISYSQFKQLQVEGAFPFPKHIVGSRNARFLLSDVLKYMEETSILSGNLGNETEGVGKQAEDLSLA